VKRVLLTGMSGTGKSTVIGEMGARGYKAVDTDGEEWLRLEDDDWVWREERIEALLATEDGEVLFVSGCRSNQGAFYHRFDHVVLLSAPTPVMLERLASRTNNPYGKEPAELAWVLRNLETVEPRLRATASLEVDTSVPLERVVEMILAHVLG
jgi:shikimate kinase